MARPTERRSTTGTVELRAASEGLGKLGGYALKYRTLSQNLGGYVETIEPGAVSEASLRGEHGDVVARWQHDDQFLLGRQSSGTLRLVGDGTGVDYTVDLPDTSYGRDVRVLADRQDLRYSSFAFRTLEEDWDYTEAGFPLRVLRSIQLVDVAPVANPAYMDTSTGLRHLAEQRGLDIEAVTKAAEVDQLATFLRERAPKVLDLAPAGGTTQTPDEDAQGETQARLAVPVRLRARRASKTS